MKQRPLPFLVLLTGVILSVFLWVLISDEETHHKFIESFTLAPPWVFLLCGIFVSMFIALMLLLFDEARERTRLLQVTQDNFKKEMSERIQAEESKQNLEKALLQGQKLQAIGTLAGGIAHDFNNLLYAITGYVEMAREDVPKKSLIYGNLGKVMEACQRGKELISRILVFSRQHHPAFSVIPIKPTIENVLSLLRPTIPASVTLNFNAVAEDHHIMGNQTQLHQIIVNIINNAVDAMDGEGTITIQLSHVKADDPILKQFPKIIHGNYCKIEITDNGCGMDQQIQERIFEPFFTTKEVGKGTGLGLSTVHTLVEEHKGVILVTSQLGHGSTFMILLPEC